MTDKRNKGHRSLHIFLSFVEKLEQLKVRNKLALVTPNSFSIGMAYLKVCCIKQIFDDYGSLMFLSFLRQFVQFPTEQSAKQIGYDNCGDTCGQDTKLSPTLPKHWLIIHYKVEYHSNFQNHWTFFLFPSFLEETLQRTSHQSLCAVVIRTCKLFVCWLGTGQPRSCPTKCIVLKELLAYFHTKNINELQKVSTPPWSSPQSSSLSNGCFPLLKDALKCFLLRSSTHNGLAVARTGEWGITAKPFKPCLLLVLFSTQDRKWQKNYFSWCSFNRFFSLFVNFFFFFDASNSPFILNSAFWTLITRPRTFEPSNICKAKSTDSFCNWTFAFAQICWHLDNTWPVLLFPALRAWCCFPVNQARTKATCPPSQQTLFSVSKPLRWNWKLQQEIWEKEQTFM